MITSRFPRVSLLLVCSAAGLLAPAGRGQAQSLAEIFRAGQVRFVPEITITDSSLAGKVFLSESLSDFALDDRGNLYVCDSREGHLLKFDAAGAFLGTIGKTGQGPGEFNYPAEIELFEGRLYVRELMTSRISIFDAGGTFTKSVPIERSAGQWWEMRVLPDGRFIVHREIIDREDRTAPQDLRLDLFSPDLAFIKTIYRQPVRRNKYIAEPVRTNVPIPFSPYVHWDILPDGKIVIGHGDAYDIEIHDPDKGKLSTFSHAYTPVEVTAKDKDDWFAGMSFSQGDASGNRVVSRGAPDYIVKNTEFPRHKPPFIDLRVDAEGNIWVQPSQASGEAAGSRMDVFDTGGRFIAAVAIGAGGTFPGRMVPCPGGFWAATYADDGAVSIIKARIAR